MELLDKDYLLQEIPLFDGLSADELQLLKEGSYFSEYKKGQIIYAEGSPPDAFYCILSGRVVIYSKDRFGNEMILEYLHRGKYFGIISLLTGEAHSVTAKALNDSTLLLIKKENFETILAKIPRLAIHLSQTLSRRLKRKDLHPKTIFESTVISVFSSYSQAGKTIYALNLALSLKKETHKTVVILDIAPMDKKHSLPQKLGLPEPATFCLSGPKADQVRRIPECILKSNYGIDLVCFFYESDDESCVKRVLDIISLLVNDYHYLILDLPSVMDRAIFSILNQSDVIHTLTSPEEQDLKKTFHLTQRLVDEFSFNPDKIRVIVNEYKLSKLNYDEQTELLGYRIFATLPKIEIEAADRVVLDAPECEYAKAVRRIARQLGESLVGLVLGVGVAYGLCHIGVLKVIEEEKIPIDVIAGSSIGALIASLWATGRSSAEILEIVSEFKEPKHIWNIVDLTFPFLGFIKGNKLYAFLKRHLGNKTFYDLQLPLKIIASDVRRKEPKVLDKGLLADAIMASCAMPGVFAPFKFSEEILFDGGIINPLPTEPLFKMGVRKIIAVNVTPSREDIVRQYELIKASGVTPLAVDRTRKKWYSIGHYLKHNFKTNILNIIFSSVELLQSEVAKKEAQLADVVLHPDTSGLFWLELHRAGEFVKRGEDETRRNLDKIWQVVNE